MSQKNRYGLNTDGTRDVNGIPSDIAGTDYESLWLANPYRTLYYDPTFWDGIGMSNKAKDINADYEAKYNEYVAGIYEKMREDVYNSEVSKVERMRQAGQNPDLLGLQHSSETSPTAPNYAPTNPNLNGQSPAVNAFQTLTQVLGFATSTLQQIKTIKGLSLDNISKENNNMFDFFKLAKPAIVDNFGKIALDPYDAPSWVDVRDVSSHKLSKAQSKYYSKAFDFLLNSQSASLQAEGYSQLDKNDYALKHYLGKYVDLSLGLKRYEHNIKQKESFLKSWQSDVYSMLADDFKNGSILAGLMLIGQTNLPAVGSRVITSTAKGLQNGYNKMIDFFKTL